MNVPDSIYLKKKKEREGERIIVTKQKERHKYLKILHSFSFEIMMKVCRCPSMRRARGSIRVMLHCSYRGEQLNLCVFPGSYDERREERLDRDDQLNVKHSGSKMFLSSLSDKLLCHCS